MMHDVHIQSFTLFIVNNSRNDSNRASLYLIFYFVTIFRLFLCSLVLQCLCESISRTRSAAALLDVAVARSKRGLTDYSKLTSVLLELSKLFRQLPKQLVFSLVLEESTHPVTQLHKCDHKLAFVPPLTGLKVYGWLNVES